MYLHVDNHISVLPHLLNIFLCVLFRTLHTSHTCIQVVYGSGPHQLTLYVLASDVHQQKEWVEALRECEGWDGQRVGWGGEGGKGR